MTSTSQTPRCCWGRTRPHIGPLPYSTTRDALTKLLKAWQWDAKPLQPRGRSQDGQGVNWSILATEDPGHWVYTLQHGDVLVSKINPEKQASVTPQHSVVASRKTIEHLQATAVDPWLHSDPGIQMERTRHPLPRHPQHPLHPTPLPPNWLLWNPILKRS